eukprot:133124-Pyramimonas_sp.AAC.1
MAVARFDVRHHARKCVSVQLAPDVPDHLNIGGCSVSCEQIHSHVARVHQLLHFAQALQRHREVDQKRFKQMVCRLAQQELRAAEPRFNARKHCGIAIALVHIRKHETRRHHHLNGRG